MIARITGKVLEKDDLRLIIDVGGVSYEVFLPQTVMQRLQESLNPEVPVTLLTYHYFQVEPSRSTPVLIGFLSQIEKEFFETFITVSGIGPKAALKALNKPISEIAQAIDEADIAYLKSLPGIGQQRARDIIAKLQNKVGKFGLIKDRKSSAPEHRAADIEEEAQAVLMQLEYKKAEAVAMIRKALERSPQISTTEDLLNEVYRQRKNL